VSVVAGERRVSRYFRVPQPIEPVGWRDAWLSAVTWLAEVKGLRDWASLLDRIPPLAQPEGAKPSGAAAAADRQAGQPSPRT
jgi:hypothetical protein